MFTDYMKLDNNKYVLFEENKGAKNVENLNEEKLLLQNKREILLNTFKGLADERREIKKGNKFFLTFGILFLILAISQIMPCFLVMGYTLSKVSIGLTIFNAAIMGLNAYGLVRNNENIKELDKFALIVESKLRKIDIDIENTKNITNEKTMNIEKGKIVSLNQKNIDILYALKEELSREYEKTTSSAHTKKLTK